MAIQQQACGWFAAVYMLTASSFIVCGEGPSPTLRPTATGRSADQLVHEALEARALGKVGAEAILARALATDPSSEPARWHGGFIREAGGWIKYDAVADDDAYRRKLDRYHTQRGTLADTLEGHAAMAHWCRERNLDMQERAHWYKVLEFDADHPIARTRLGYLRIGGNWVTHDEIESTRRREIAAERAYKKWATALRPIRIAFESNDSERTAAARKRLAAIHDPAAIPAMEAMLSSVSLEAATAVVQAVSRMPGPEAAVGLARQAVFAEWYPTGNDAAVALRNRDELNYVPLMLSALATPPGDTFQVSHHPGGGAGKLLVRYEFEQERQSRSEKVTYDVSYGAWIASRTPAGLVPAEMIHANDRYAVPAIATRNNIQAAAMLDREVAGRRDSFYRFFLKFRAEGDQEKVAAQIEEEDRSTQDLNRRICRALRTATLIPDGEMTTDNPRIWWNWWNERREVIAVGPKPVAYSKFASQEYEEVPQFIPPPTRAVNVVGSCLVAGTTVYTDVGPRPVDQIRLGDRVLAQNVETGELAYRVVLEPTVRPAAPTVVIKFGDRQIQATGGHPFWAVGRGWTKAREFETGMRMACVGGTVEVTGIEPAGDAPAYNLVVDEFHTYFVGDALVLSHDNRPPEPTRGSLPGETRVSLVRP